jgi:elongation factor G
MMDASGHVEAGLESAVALARINNRPTLFFLNKCERENANPTNAVDALRTSFGQKVAALHVAIGAAESFAGYVDLIHNKAYQLQGGKEVEVPVPGNLASEVATRRDQLIEAASEADDDVMTKYLEGEQITDEELETCLHKAVRSGMVAPVLVGSAAKDTTCLLQRSSTTSRPRTPRAKKSRSPRRQAARSWPASSRRPPIRTSAG